MDLSKGLPHKLTQWVILSILSMAFFASPSRAHELNPTIADFTVTDGTLVLDLQMNAEAFLAELNLDGVRDTNDADGAVNYDALQNQTGADIEALFAAQADDFAKGLVVSSGETAVALAFQSIKTPVIALPEVARLSAVQFTANLPAEARDISFAWGAGYGEIVIRQQGVEEPYTGFLVGGETTPDIALAGGAAMTGWQSFVSYIPVGFDHILPKGLDHILFVLGLFFLSLRMGALLWQVTAFTAAHTVTLALGALGVITVPGSIVEPIIAASIVYVGVENILSKGLNKWRPIVVFGFGLLHGLGFASVLGDFGLPAGQFIPALLGFNIGVELGQLTVIAVAFLAVGLWFGSKPWYKNYIANPASAAIALVGAYWVIERVFL
ncbi:MAG: HupE/UreJ family protein [Cognatishimia sp.]